MNNLVILLQVITWIYRVLKLSKDFLIIGRIYSGGLVAIELSIDSKGI